MAGISTANIPSPNVVSIPAANYDLISTMQLLQPHWYREFVNNFGQQKNAKHRRMVRGQLKTGDPPDGIARFDCCVLSTLC